MSDKPQQSPTTASTEQVLSRALLFAADYVKQTVHEGVVSQVNNVVAYFSREEAREDCLANARLFTKEDPKTAALLDHHYG